MALYRATVKCFVGNALREEGEEFEYNGPKNTNLELVSGPAEEDEPVEKAPARKWTPKAKRASEAGADEGVA